MNRFCAVMIAFALAGGLRAEDSPKAIAVKKAATSYADATKSSDIAKTLDHTYPGVIEFLGGRDKAASRIEASQKQMKEKGIEIKSSSVGDPGEFFTEGKNTFVVVPVTTILAFAKGSVRSKSFLLGISSDEGKSWTFVDGISLQEPTQREKIAPKLPEKLKLPAKEKPELLLPKKDD